MQRVRCVIQLAVGVAIIGIAHHSAMSRCDLPPRYRSPDFRERFPTKCYPIDEALPEYHLFFVSLFIGLGLALAIGAGIGLVRRESWMESSPLALCALIAVAVTGSYHIVPSVYPLFW